MDYYVYLNGNCVRACSNMAQAQDAARVYTIGRVEIHHKGQKWRRARGVWSPVT